MGRYAFDACRSTNPLQDAWYTDEMAIGQVTGENIAVLLALRLRLDELKRGSSQRAHLWSGLGIREAHATVPFVDPFPLEAKRFHLTKTREQD